MTAVKGRGIKLLFLFWLAWYGSGPLLETIDYWDSPREEINDVIRSAGGTVTLIATAVGFGIALLRRLRERCRYLSRAGRRRLPPFTVGGVISQLLWAPVANPSPPLPLRI